MTAVKVEQCDRINAAAITALAELRPLILAGKCDDGQVVQAFAAARVAERERCAAVAGQYARCDAGAEPAHEAALNIVAKISAIEAGEQGEGE